MTPLSPPDLPTRATGQLARVEEMTDARVMAPRLRAALGATGRTPCHVLDAKYEPGVRCTVLYRVGHLLVRGDLVDEATAAEAFRPVVDPGVRLSPFPHDPDLPGLSDAADPVRLRDALRGALPGAGGILGCRVELLRYRPGKRATLAVGLRGRADPSLLPGRHLVVKSYHDGAKAAAVAAEAVLLDATVDPSAPLRFAPVRAHLPALSLVVQERLPGVRLDEVLRTPGPSAARALRRAAVALAALHAQPVVSGRTRAIEAELTRFLTRSLRVADVDPGTGRALADLATRLAATAQDITPGRIGLVHGDCKPSQFLLSTEREVVLLDLDSCGSADRAGDVGTFLATLRQHTLREVLARRTTPSAARAREAVAQVFVREYIEAVGGVPDVELRRRISWYEAVAFERKALRSFARAPRSPLTRALLDSGHACLDRLGQIR